MRNAAPENSNLFTFLLWKYSIVFYYYIAKLRCFLFFEKQKTFCRFINDVRFGWHVGKVMTSFNLTALFQEAIFFLHILSAAFHPLHRSRQCDTGALEAQQK